jgi:LPXTG-motif cell wall-anchored protein
MVSAVAGKPGVYIVDATSASNTVETPENGAVVITGLEGISTYYLKETVAPDGYNLLTDPVAVTIVEDVKDKDGNVTEQKGSNITVAGATYYVNHTAINVENFSGVELPSTGGEGTMLMITIGTMVAMAFAVLMITQKKMSIYQD